MPIGLMFCVLVFLETLGSSRITAAQRFPRCHRCSTNIPQEVRQLGDGKLWPVCAAVDASVQ